MEIKVTLNLEDFDQFKKQARIANSILSELHKFLEIEKIPGGLADPHSRIDYKIAAKPKHVILDELVDIVNRHKEILYGNDCFKIKKPCDA